MDPSQQPELTNLINDASAGDRDSQEKLWSILYADVRRQAAALVRRKSDDIEPTEVVSAVFLRLQSDKPQKWDNRRHYFGAVARAMQQYLVDEARGRNRLKRGGGRARIPLTIAEGELSDPEPFDEAMLADVFKALDVLEAEKPEFAEVVRLRFLMGMKVDEAAEVTGMAPRTVKKYWRLARAKLLVALEEMGHKVASEDPEPEPENEDGP